MNRTPMSTGQEPEGPVVCVIDDDPSMRRSLGRLLRTSQWRVQSFASAEAFLAELNKFSSGILIVDVQLPGMTGLELLERIQEIDMSRPAIVMSGSDDESFEREALRLGATTFLRKPFVPQLLLDTLELLAQSSNGKPLRSSG